MCAGWGLNCDYWGPRSDQSLEPLFCLGGLGGTGKDMTGIAFSALFPLDSDVPLPVPSLTHPHQCPYLDTASLCCLRKTETRWLLWGFV